MEKNNNLIIISALFQNEEFNQNILQYLSINDKKYLNKKYYNQYKREKKEKE